MRTNMMPVGMIFKSRILPPMKESLAQYVSRVMREKNLSGYEVQRRSRDRITQSHVHRIQNGQAKNVSADKLQALAKGLDVPATELFAIVTGKALTGTELTHDRLASIDFAYEGMPKDKKEKANYIIELLEREIQRISEEPEE